MWLHGIMAWKVADSLFERQQVLLCKTIRCARADRNRLWWESIRAATLQPSSPFSWLLGSRSLLLPAPGAQDRNQPVFYLSVLSSPFQSSIPPYSPSSTLFFFFKWRTVMACIELTREAENEGGGGEKVMGCTIASHTTFKCFSPTHSRNGKWGGMDNMCSCMSCSSRCGKLDCDSALQCDLSATQFSLTNTTKKIHHPNQLCFPWPGSKVPLLLGRYDRESTMSWRENNRDWK